jgi:hypothetical protein
MSSSRGKVLIKAGKRRERPRQRGEFLLKLMNFSMGTFNLLIEWKKTKPRFIARKHGNQLDFSDADESDPPILARYQE